MTLRREHDPDFFTTLGSSYGTLVMLVLCDCREYIVASRGLCFEPTLQVRSQVLSSSESV
jgi:hypothetical protein